MSTPNKIAQLKAEFDKRTKARSLAQGAAQQRDEVTLSQIDALIAEDPGRIARFRALKGGRTTGLNACVEGVGAVAVGAETAPSNVIAQIDRLNQADDGDALAKLIADINREYFITVEGSKVVIIQEGEDHELGGSKLSYLNQNGFTLLLKDTAVRVGDRVIDVATAWMRDPRRRAYKRGMALLPHQAVPEGVYNLWRGWGVTPVAGEHRPMLSFIRHVICDNDETAYDYLIGWLARAVQYPERQAEVAVVLKSEGRGTGKGTLGRAFIQLFGAHGKHLLHSRHLKGNFNAHLRTALGVFADEALFVGDKEGNEVLKGLITEPTIMIEPKGIDAFDVRNRLKIMMATNSEWAVPAAADERRYFILEVSECRKQDTEYFRKLNAYLDNGGLAAWLDYLLKLDISDFDIRKVPSTGALAREKVRSLDPFAAWIHEKLYRGTWDEHEAEWSELRPNEAVIREYEEHCHRKGLKYENTTGQSIGRRLNRLFPSSTIQRRTVQRGQRLNYRTLPPLDQARGDFENAALGGDPGDWPTVIDAELEAEAG